MMTPSVAIQPSIRRLLTPMSDAPKRSLPYSAILPSFNCTVVKSGKAIIAVRVMSPELFAPSPGLSRVVDPETGRKVVVDWRSPKVRHAYRARIDRWRLAFADQCERAGVDILDVPVLRHADKDAIARPILRFFSMRGQRGMKR